MFDARNSNKPGFCSSDKSQVSLISTINMTTACSCFGRNEHCKLCNGSGLLSSEVERRVASLDSRRFYSAGQSEEQKALDAAAWMARDRAALVPPRKKATGVDERVASHKRWVDEIAERQMWAQSRRQETEENKEVLDRVREQNQEELQRQQAIQVKNEEVRAMRAHKEAALRAVLAEKQEAIAQGKKMVGPYRCMRCQWINESDRQPCYLCKASDRYVEIF